MASLPPEDDAFWDQMEEDIAAERWPVPSIFAGLDFWFRGAANELHRRATFRRQLTRSLASKLVMWIVAWIGFSWVLDSAIWLGRYLTQPRPVPLHLTDSIAFALLGLTVVADELACRFLFKQSYQRYVRHREPASAL